MRYLAIDLGNKRTGFALGDSITRVVTPVAVVEVGKSENSGKSLVRAVIGTIAAHLGPPSAGVALVIGLPLNMDGSEGPASKGVRAFASEITAIAPYTVHFQDERLTTVEADWSMARSGLSRGQKKARRDALAAAAILRDFLATSVAHPASD